MEPGSKTPILGSNNPPITGFTILRFHDFTFYVFSVVDLLSLKLSSTKPCSIATTVPTPSLVILIPPLPTHLQRHISQRLCNQHQRHKKKNVNIISILSMLQKITSIKSGGERLNRIALRLYLAQPNQVVLQSKTTIRDPPFVTHHS